MTGALGPSEFARQPEELSYRVQPVRAYQGIHSVLSPSELISDVRWHYKEDIDALNEGGQIRTTNKYS